MREMKVQELTFSSEMSGFKSGCLQCQDAWSAFVSDVHLINIVHVQGIKGAHEPHSRRAMSQSSLLTWAVKATLPRTRHSSWAISYSFYHICVHSKTPRRIISRQPTFALSQTLRMLFCSLNPQILPTNAGMSQIKRLTTFANMNGIQTHGSFALW